MFFLFEIIDMFDQVNILTHKTSVYFFMLFTTFY